MNLHILLVDDDLSYRRSLMIQLELEGYRVTEKESAEQALDFLAREHQSGRLPHVVITDVKMDGMDGATFVAHLEQRYPDLPVVVISAYDLPQSLGEYPFLKKPFKMEMMNNVLQKNTAQKRAYRVDPRKK